MRSVLTSSCRTLPHPHTSPQCRWRAGCRCWCRITGRQSAQHCCRAGGCVEAASPPCPSPSCRPAAAAAAAAAGGGGGGGGCAAC